MAADESNEHQSLRVANSDHQSEVVALDVEHNPVIRQKTGVPMRSFDVGRRLPFSMADFGVPAT